jgi:hypothetical protein
VLQSRSTEESQLYMDLQPCPGCGTQGFEWEEHLTEVRDEALVAVYRGACIACGTGREFEFELLAGDPAELEFGGPEPSRIIDPGQFFALAREAAAVVPASPGQCPPAELDDAREAIAMAVSAIGEVGKFVPADGDAVPPDAFTSEIGRAVYAADPTQFRRARLDAVATAYRDVHAAYLAV